MCAGHRALLELDVVLGGNSKAMNVQELSVRETSAARQMKSVSDPTNAAVGMDTSEPTVRPNVLNGSGARTARRCVSATRTGAVPMRLASAPVTRTAGGQPAIDSVHANMGNATRIPASANASHAAGVPPVQTSATAAPTPSVIPKRASASARPAGGGAVATTSAPVTARHVTSWWGGVSARRNTGGTDVSGACVFTGNVTLPMDHARVILDTEEGTAGRRVQLDILASDVKKGLVEIFVCELYDESLSKDNGAIVHWLEIGCRTCDPFRLAYRSPDTGFIISHPSEFYNDNEMLMTF
ncbi:hypothetical protein scyTo_0009928 [Scyliorhinus torazame]|uniref:Uncharacterized protein n=1 Tax=Scyliorhinus torazame TaxID=75743 RepID=A0A401NWD2_SCYTO|nr:hypothetical protein [Scyliorhinus torazame]